MDVPLRGDSPCLPNLPAGDYILVVDGNAGAECEWTFLSNTLLELRMLDFNAFYSHEHSAIIVDWEVHPDDNNDIFIVERSTDGISFEEVVTIDADDQTTYTYIDEDYPDQAYLYYRIQAVDQHDVVDFSDVRVVRNVSLNETTEGIQAIYPNPTHSSIHVPVVSSEGTTIQMSLMGVDGRLVKNIPVQHVDNGYQLLTVDVNDVSAGLYYLRIYFGDKLVMRKVHIL